MTATSEKSFQRDLVGIAQERRFNHSAFEKKRARYRYRASNLRHLSDVLDTRAPDIGPVGSSMAGDENLDLPGLRFFRFLF